MHGYEGILAGLTVEDKGLILILLGRLRTNTGRAQEWTVEDKGLILIIIRKNTGRAQEWTVEDKGLILLSAA